MDLRVIEMEGAAVTVRPMTSDYIIGDDPDKYGIRAEIGCAFNSRWPNPVYAAYARKITDTYGIAGIMAWQDTSLVGYLPVIPMNCGMPPVPHCASVPIDDRADAIASAELIPFKELEQKILKVQCLSVAKRLHRKGVGSAMAQSLIDWSRDQGWERIQGWAFADADIDDSYRWLPSIDFWEKAGFTRGESCVFDPGDPATNKPGFTFSADLRE